MKYKEELAAIRMEIKYLKKIMYVIGSIVLANLGMGNIEVLTMGLMG